MSSTLVASHAAVKLCPRHRSYAADTTRVLARSVHPWPRRDLTLGATVLHSRGPVETAVDLGSGGRLWQTGVLIVVLVALGVLWLWWRRSDSRHRLRGMFAYLAAAAGLAAIIPWVRAPWDAYLRPLALIVFLFGIVRALVVGTDAVARRRRMEFSTILRDLIVLLLYVVIVLVVVHVTFAVDITPLIATSAVVTAVIGLALQETLGNVFSGLSLQQQKPFQPGDWVRFEGYLGRVQGIGWRSTRLVTRNLELLDVPNARLAREILTNYRGTALGDELFVSASYDTPPNRTKEVIQRLLANNPDVAKVPPPQVMVVDYGDFAIKYCIHFWMVDYARQEGVRDAIMTSIWYAFRRSGIEIPYPIRTVHMHQAAPVTDDVDRAHHRRMMTLRQVDFLSELSDEEIAMLAPSLRDVGFGRGEVVCREGDPGTTLFVIRRGTVEVVARGADGREAHVADLSSPAFFGEMAVLTGEPRAATVRAKSDTELLVVEREGFEALFRSRPGVAEAMCQVLATRQSELRERREQAHASDTTESRASGLLQKIQATFRF